MYFEVANLCRASGGGGDNRIIMRCYSSAVAVAVREVEARWVKGSASLSPFQTPHKNRDCEKQYNPENTDDFSFIL
jgi:hypothetical protein